MSLARGIIKRRAKSAKRWAKSYEGQRVIDVLMAGTFFAIIVLGLWLLWWWAFYAGLPM